MTRMQKVLDAPAVTRAIQIVAVISLLLALAVGVKQFSLANCLAGYADKSAKSTTQRAEAAAEDRKADQADRQADAQDRQALKTLIDAIATQDQVKAKAAFGDLVATYRTTDAARADTAKARAENERKRAKNPVPPSPSLKCG